MTKILFSGALLMGIAPPTYGLFNLQPSELHTGLRDTGDVPMLLHETQSKPHLSYQQFLAQQTPVVVVERPVVAVDPRPTIGQLIERYIVEMNGLDGRPPVREVGRGHLFLLKRLQREPIAAVVGEAFTRNDIIAHCRRRIDADQVIPATVMKDVVALSGVLKYAAGAWDDCSEISDEPIRKAKAFLTKNNLIGMSEPRTRRPTDAEHATLIAYFEKRAESGRVKIPMAWCANWQRASARRISETCGLRWDDWNRDDRTILVRKMKDPRNRNKNKLVALTPDAQAMLVDQYGKRDPNEPRIFPYRAESCSAAYTQAKKATGIDGLHLHDSRRDRATKLVQEDGYTPAEATCVTGHETVQVFERTYLTMDPALLKNGPRSRRLGESAATEGRVAPQQENK